MPVVMTSSSVTTTSFPSPKGAPTNQDEPQALLIAGLAIAGVLLVAIVGLVIALIAVCCSKNEEDREKPCKEENDDMEYCEAYVLNGNTAINDYTLKEGMVRNSAYRNCTVEEGSDPTMREPQGKQLQQFTVREREKLSPPATLAHNYTNVYRTDRGSNDYEEVF